MQSVNTVQHYVSVRENCRDRVWTMWVNEGFRLKRQLIVLDPAFDHRVVLVDRRLVGFATSNSNPGAGADIVMESITLTMGR